MQQPVYLEVTKITDHYLFITEEKLVSCTHSEEDKEVECHVFSKILWVQKQKQGKAFLYDESKADIYSSMQARKCKSFFFHAFKMCQNIIPSFIISKNNGVSIAPLST